MPAQDDVREREMRSVFNLVRPEEYGRADIDAVLELEGAAVPAEIRGMTIPFELKSATSGEPDISTVRDLGMHHVEKWRSLHWLFGVYDRDRHGDLKLQYCLYGGPSKMKPWLDSVAAYAAADLKLAGYVPDLMTDETLTAVLGDADEFTYEDVHRLLKSQGKVADYREASDRPDARYSRAAMLRLLQVRCRYLIQRGSTRNNPHISPSYFTGWEKINRNHAARLRELVIEEIQAQEAQADKTED
jgi:hypothetical protein